MKALDQLIEMATELKKVGAIEPYEAEVGRDFIAQLARELHPQYATQSVDAYARQLIRAADKGQLQVYGITIKAVFR